MPIVLVALILMLAVLVHRLRADADTGSGGRGIASPSDWLCEAVVDDRDRELAFATSRIRWR